MELFPQGMVTNAHRSTVLYAHAWLRGVASGGLLLTAASSVLSIVIYICGMRIFILYPIVLWDVDMLYQLYIICV